MKRIVSIILVLVMLFSISCFATQSITMNISYSTLKTLSLFEESANLFKELKNILNITEDENHINITLQTNAGDPHLHNKINFSFYDQSTIYNIPTDSNSRLNFYFITTNCECIHICCYFDITKINIEDLFIYLDNLFKEEQYHIISMSFNNSHDDYSNIHFNKEYDYLLFKDCIKSKIENEINIWTDN